MSWSRTIAGDDAAALAMPRRRESALERMVGEVRRVLLQDDPVAHRYLLWLRFLLANGLALALLGAAAAHGWIGAVLASDSGGYALAIVATFLLGLLWSGQRSFELSRALNEVEQFSVETDGGARAGARAARPQYLRQIEGRDGQSRAILASSLRLRLAGRLAPIRHIANSLVLLGLIGTVIGFIIALSGVQLENVSDVSSIGPTVAALIQGMSVALYTTLVGSVLHVWLMINVRLLEGGTIRLLSTLVELGERHERA
jgi:hypothetical protein